MSAILVSNDFVPWGVLIPLLKDSNSALEALGWDLNDLPPVPASFLLTLSQITSIYSATVHHNPRYLLICLHGYCVLILNLPKKGSYLHWTFWPGYNTITDNREYCLQKNTIPRAALKATFQSLITQHWIREERKKTSSRHLLPRSLRRKPELPARYPPPCNIPPAWRAWGSYVCLIPRAGRKQEIMKCDVVRADSAQHCQERTFWKAQHFQKNHQSFLSSTKCYFAFTLQNRMTLRPRTKMRGNTSYCNIVYSWNSGGCEHATCMLTENEGISSHQQAFLKHLWRPATPFFTAKHLNKINATIEQVGYLPS